jgi:hypothetical protein
MQYATSGIRVIVMTIAAVVDAVLPTAVRMPFEQPQFSKQFRVIRYSYYPARE